jgi:hypothetical protein
MIHFVIVIQYHSEIIAVLYGLHFAIHISRDLQEEETDVPETV